MKHGSAHKTSKRTEPCERIYQTSNKSTAKQGLPTKHQVEMGRSKLLYMLENIDFYISKLVQLEKDLSICYILKKDKDQALIAKCSDH